MIGYRAVVSIRVVIASTVLLCLAACSGTTFVYNRLDTILPWYLDDYVDLDSTQERQLDASLGAFLTWHRQQELPQYVELLAELDASLDQPLTAADVKSLYEGMEVAWLRLEEESLDWLLELGDTLSDAQVQEFLGYLQERQEEYEQEYLPRTETEYRDELYDSFADSFEDYLGSLTSEQRERLQVASAALQRSDEVWLQARAAWLQRLAVTMERQPGWQLRLREAIAQRGETVAPRYRKVYQHNLDVIIETVADVLNERTEKQDRHLRKELAMLREDMQTLIAQGAAKAAKAA